MKSRAIVAIICAVLVCVAGVGWMAATNEHSLSTWTYSQFLSGVQAGRVASVVMMESNSGAVPAICRLKDGKAVRTILPSNYRDAITAMQEKGINIEVRDSSAGALRVFLNAIPFLLLLSLWIVLIVCKAPNRRFLQT